MERVSELVKQQIGTVLQELNLTDCGLVTVTSAVVSPDLHGHIQHELARRIILKNTPRLKFILDETELHAQRIETLLAKLNPPESDD